MIHVTYLKKVFPSEVESFNFILKPPQTSGNLSNSDIWQKEPDLHFRDTQNNFAYLATLLSPWVTGRLLNEFTIRLICRLLSSLADHTDMFKNYPVRSSQALQLGHQAVIFKRTNRHSVDLEDRTPDCSLDRHSVVAAGFWRWSGRWQRTKHVTQRLVRNRLSVLPEASGSNASRSQDLSNTGWV